MMRKIMDKNASFCPHLACSAAQPILAKARPKLRGADSRWARRAVDTVRGVLVPGYFRPVLPPQHGEGL